MSHSQKTPLSFFPRETSGIVRPMSPGSALAYNVLTMGLIFPWVFFWGPASFPEGHLVLGIIFAVLIQLPISLSYSYLASLFPRSGGDYVFQSRALGPLVGFVSTMSGFVIWILMWVALSGWLMARLGLAPLFLGLSYHFEDTALLAIGRWFQSPAGVVWVSCVQGLLATRLLNKGFRKYVAVQRILIGSTLVAFVLMLWELWIVEPSQFQQAIDQMARWVLQDTDVALGKSGFYDSVAEQSPKIDGWTLGATLALVPIAWTSLQWASYSVQQGAEISHADSLRDQIVMLVSPVVVVGGLLAILAYVEQLAVGGEFLRGLSRLYHLHEGPPEIVAGVQILQPMPNVLVYGVTTSTLVLVIIAVGYIANAFQVTCNCFIGVSRILTTMSVDGLMPNYLSRVDDDVGTPTFAHWTYFFLSLPVIWAYSYWPTWGDLTLGVTFACGYVFILSNLAACVFSLDRKFLGNRRLSPRSRSWFAVFGLLGLFGGLGMLGALLLLPEYNINSPLGLLVVGGVILLSVLWYATARWKWRRRGVEIEFAFKQVSGNR